MSPKKKKISIALGATFGAIVVIIVVIIFCLTGWLGTYTHHDEAVKVPAVVGVQADLAMQMIEVEGLKPMVIDSVYGEGKPGAVIEQLPEGGLPVKLGRIVYLTINATSRQMIQMISVRDWSSRQAQSRLQEIGFLVDSIVYVPCEFDDLVLNVTAQSREALAGESFPIRTHIVLHVGSTQVPIEAQNDTTEQEWFE